MVVAYREHLRQFVETVKPDLISYDHYHFFKDTDTPQYFLNLGLIRQAAMEAEPAVFEYHPGQHRREGLAASEDQRTSLAGLYDDGVRRAGDQLFHLLGSGIIRRDCTRMAKSRRWPGRWRS